MCTGKCARCIANTLYPLVLLSITCNIILFFPGWDVKYVKDGHITDEVKYLGGLIGGGIMVLIPALYIQLTGEQGCCANRCGMLFSIVFAAMGAVGAVYSFIVALLALSKGPLCFYRGQWTVPFHNSDDNYMTDSTLWRECTEPNNVVQFHIGLFFTLVLTSSLQGVLCAVQMINGLFGCLCGTGNDDGVRKA